MVVRNEFPFLTDICMLCFASLSAKSKFCPLNSHPVNAVAKFSVAKVSIMVISSMTKFEEHFFLP